MDWDNDGKKDLIAGDTEGQVWLFLNTGTAEKPVLAEGKRVEADGKEITGKREFYKEVNGNYVVDKVIPGNHELAEVYSKLHMADWDGDGLRDLLIGHENTIIMYKNVGTPSAPRFEAPVKIRIPEGDFPSRPSPYVVDWDDDGNKDLLVGTDMSIVYFHRNTGSNRNPQLARGQALNLKVPPNKAGYRWRIEVTDWNNDGKKDILAGNYFNNGGNIWLFLGK